MKILGIETSCDETAISIISAHGDFGKDFSYSVLGEALISQATLHAQYGGVFPNLAKREHSRNLTPLLMEALRTAHMFAEGKSADEAMIAHVKSLLSREEEMFIFLSDFFRTTAKPDIDVLAVTVGPGLEPALWVGINFARSLSTVWNVPIVPVDHMEGHIVIAALENGNDENLKFPALALLVSGGHTELVLMREWMKYEILGSTRDDAAGEAFDKCARLLDLPYPGGPEISRLAAMAREKNSKPQFVFPRPMITQDNLEFSFSGLKTEVRKHVGDSTQLSPDTKVEIARGVEDAIVHVLVAKTMKAFDQTDARTLIVGGGVSANQHLRSELAKALEASVHSPSVLTAPPELSTDNARMIALTGYFRAQQKEFAHLESLKASGNKRLT